MTQTSHQTVSILMWINLINDCVTNWNIFAQVNIVWYFYYIERLTYILAYFFLLTIDENEWIETMEMAFYNISKLYTIVFSLIVLIIARYYLNENYLNQNDFTINNDSIERSIIKSWKNLVTLPIRNSNHNLVVAIGYNNVYFFFILFK